MGREICRQHAAGEQRREHRLRAPLRQRLVHLFAALAVGIAADFHRHVGAGFKDLGDLVDGAPGRQLDLGRAGRESDLGRRHRLVDRGGAFLRRGQRRFGIELLFVADIHPEILGLAKFFRQHPADLGRGIAVAGGAAHVNHERLHHDRAVGELAQRFERGQRAQRPAARQLRVEPHRGIDLVDPEPRPRDAFNHRALLLVGDPTAQLHQPLGAERDDELRRPRRLAGAGDRHRVGQHRMQREHVGQIGLKLAGDAIERVLRRALCGHQRDVGIGKGQRSAAHVVQRRDPARDGIGPVGRRHAETDGAIGLALHPGGDPGSNDLAQARLGMGGAGIEARAGGVDGEAQGERRDHRARRGDIERDPHPARRIGAQPFFPARLLLGAIGNRLDRHPVGAHRDLAARQHFKCPKGEFQRRVPAVGHRVVGGFQQVGDRLRKVDLLHPPTQRLAVSQRRDQADHRDPRLAAQHLDREFRRLDRLGGGHFHEVDHPAGIHFSPGDRQRVKARAFGRRDARERHLEPVRLNRGPFLALKQQRPVDGAFRQALDRRHRAPGRQRGH